MRLAALALSTSLIALSLAPALAADVPATSQIGAVTVFPAGAEVTRSAKVRLEPGEHAVIFKDLPAQAVPSSIRVEGKATGRLEIGSVDTRRIGVPRTDPAQQAGERRRLETEIEKLKDARAVVEAEVKAAETQKALIQKLTELPEHPAPAPAGGAAAQPDWGQLLGLIGQRSTEVHRAELDARVRMRDTDRKIEDLQKALAAIKPDQESRTEAKVFVAAASSLEAELTIRYQVPQASWTPYYDARLVTGGRDAAPKLNLVRRASVQQRSGEDWVDVAIQLSTTRPGSGTAAPELAPMSVDFEPEFVPPPAPPQAAMPAPGGAVRALRAPASAKMADNAAALMSEDREEAARERTATVDAAAFQVLFGVPGKLTVLGNGEQKRVQLDQANLDPALVVRTVPRIDARAFLYAKLQTPRTTPYLPGQVSLFRDGTFVGNGRLKALTPGEEFELGFGVDDAVRVRHAVVDDKRAEGGIITSSKSDTRNYRIAVKNQHARPIQLSILDQIPVSQNQDIKVELVTKTQPTRRDLEDKRGVLAWDGEVKADEERVLEFGYKVTWPGAKRIHYGRF